MRKDAHTYEYQHQAFIKYLMDRFDGDEDEVAAVIETAERIIPNTLHDYFGTEYESIYEITEVNDIEDFRKKIKLDPILKGIDKNVEPSYTEVLKWYRLFVKSMQTDAAPIPVSGEMDSQQPSIVAEEMPPARRQRTIYLEGEAGEAQNIVYRQRNQELRQACIEHFKTLHGGRIVCECCGFDFAKAYDIDDEYIEVHHRFPFSQTDGEHAVDAITDLVPLCANCHRMIHHGMGGRGNCMTLDELKMKLR